MHVLEDEEGDLGLFLFPHFFYLISEPEKPILGTSIFHRGVDVQHARACANFVENFNRNYYLPKLFTVVSDQGKITFRVSHCFSWGANATDQQLDAELDTFVRSALECFAALEQYLADPWVNPSGESQ